MYLYYLSSTSTTSTVPLLLLQYLYYLCSSSTTSIVPLKPLQYLYYLSSSSSTSPVPLLSQQYLYYFCHTSTTSITFLVPLLLHFTFPTHPSSLTSLTTPTSSSTTSNTTLLPHYIGVLPLYSISTTFLFYYSLYLSLTLYSPAYSTACGSFQCDFGWINGMFALFQPAF